MKLETLLDGLVFGEGPRWRGDRLWLSDMHAHTVLTVDLAGKREDVLEVPGQPSGLGWLPDGRLLVVSMTDPKLLRRDGGTLAGHADLAALARFHCNDMVVCPPGIHRHRLRPAQAECQEDPGHEMALRTQPAASIPVP